MPIYHPRMINPMTLNLKYVVIMQKRSLIFWTIQSKYSTWRHDAHSSSEDESSFSGGGGPPADPREGGVPVCNMHQGEGEPRGGGTVMSHPKRGGGTMMSYPNRGGGTVGVTQRGGGDGDESCKRGVSQGGSANHNQGEGVGANYVNV